MRTNPVFEEGVRLYLIEGESFAVYFFLLVILGLVQFSTLLLSSYDPEIWLGTAYLFKISAVSALILIIYFGLRIADQEFASWKFFPLKRWLGQERISLSQFAAGQLALLCLHSFLLVFFSSPLLIWAAAIARASVTALGFTFFLLLFYSLAYGVWALVALTLFEHRAESREVFVRCVFISLVFLSALIYLPLNPIAFLLSYLGKNRAAPLAFWGWRFSAAAVHLFFHLAILTSGLLAYQGALRRRAILDLDPKKETAIK